jgi:hypothetical protein
MQWVQGTSWGKAAGGVKLTTHLQLVVMKKMLAPTLLVCTREVLQMFDKDD